MLFPSKKKKHAKKKHTSVCVMKIMAEEEEEEEQGVLKDRQDDIINNDEDDVELRGLSSPSTIPLNENKEKGMMTTSEPLGTLPTSRNINNTFQQLYSPYSAALASIDGASTKMKSVIILSVVAAGISMLIAVICFLLWVYHGLKNGDWFNLFALFGMSLFICLFVGSIALIWYLKKKIKQNNEERELKLIQNFLKVTEDIMSTDINKNPNLDVRAEIERTEECLRIAGSTPAEILQKHDLDPHIVHVQLWSRLAILYYRIDDQENAKKYTDLCENA
jgi:heme/copper-type cytochrome/quinol oxidase subunit 4